MSFQEKYTIIPRYLTSGSRRRSGRPISGEMKFIVAHDTGNPDSTAAGNVRYYENSRNEMSASAHLFVDDKEIIECIPALTGIPEKAWHVLYNVPTDDALYGVNANDAAIGVEYCYGVRINADEAYKRYVWVMAFVCYRFNLDPKTSVVGHFFLDPRRKTDPVTGLAHSRRTYEQLLRDVIAEYDECTGEQMTPPLLAFVDRPGVVTTKVKLNIRKGAPSTKAPIARTLSVGQSIEYVGWVTDGEPINGNARWYKRLDDEFFWSGSVG